MNRRIPETYRYFPRKPGIEIRVIFPKFRSEDVSGFYLICREYVELLFKVRIFQFYSLFAQVEFEPGVTENNRLALKVFVEVGYKKETSENIYPVFLPAGLWNRS